MVLRKVKHLRHLLTVKATQPDTVNAEFLCLIHHCCSNNRSVLFAGVVVFVATVMGIAPGDIVVVADQKHQRRVEVRYPYTSRFFQGFFTLDHVDMLRLKIGSCRLKPSGFQNFVDLLLFYVTGVKQSLRIAILCQLKKVKLISSFYCSFVLETSLSPSAYAFYRFKGNFFSRCSRFFSSGNISCISDSI